MSKLALYPTLASHVLARRHFCEGEELVVLHSTQTGASFALGSREWTLLQLADGTRTLDGLVRAAVRHGLRPSLQDLTHFLQQLQDDGLLDDELDHPQPTPQINPDRPLAFLPDFRLLCDGHGSCCRIYATVLFSPIETARARTLLPMILDAGSTPERAFTPEHGPGPCAGSAVALVDGQCAYLASNALCSLHQAGGPSAKPLGCTLFPATFADDGEHVRISVAVECACVLASLDQEQGSPLLPASPSVRRDLDPAIHVVDVPENILIHANVLAPRHALITWSNAVLAASPPHDTPATCFALASALEAFGPDTEHARSAVLHPPPLSPKTLLPWLDALARRATRLAIRHAAWRSKRDLARIATQWIADAATALLLPGVVELVLEHGASSPRHEAFYLQAQLHGHQLVGDIPLATALRDRAVRLLVARAMKFPLSQTPDHPANTHPLALVEAILRGHGLGTYVHDVST